ncbi:MAG TPA: superoxide dismutase [Caulobacteraceae bacterium]|nr:superoxide dismutase [Caulobacteraceae bacterium]
MIVLPNLPYPHSALEPVISETTMRTHHGKHHARYVDVTNTLLAEAGASSEDLEAIVAKAWKRSETKLFNNAAQAFNHGFFWNCMHPGGQRPSPAFAGVAEAELGGPNRLKAAFMAEGAGHFGSGWVWLLSQSGELRVEATHDGDTAARMEGVTPLLVCDLWEHAYYLDYRNDRAAYLAAWWDNLVNWPFVERQYAASIGQAPAWTYPSADREILAGASSSLGVAAGG